MYHPDRYPLRAVFFDLDGTLVDSREDVLEAFHHAFGRLDMETPPPERLQELIGIRLEDCFIPFLGADEEACRKAARHFRQYYQKHFIDHTRPFSGIPRALRELSARYPLGIASMKKGRYARELVRACGWLSTFNRVIGSEEGYPAKPDPTMLQALCRTFEFPPEHVVYVGDTQVDLETARAASIRYFHAGWGYGRLAPDPGETLGEVLQQPSDLIRIFVDDLKQPEQD